LGGRVPGVAAMGGPPTLHRPRTESDGSGHASGAPCGSGNARLVHSAAHSDAQPRRRDATDRCRRSLTVVMATHQLQFVAASDLIVVMEGGRVAQAGGYAELLAQGGSSTESETDTAAAAGAGTVTASTEVREELVVACDAAVLVTKPPSCLVPARGSTSSLPSTRMPRHNLFAAMIAERHRAARALADASAGGASGADLSAIESFTADSLDAGVLAVSSAAISVDAASVVMADAAASECAVPSHAAGGNDADDDTGVFAEAAVGTGAAGTAVTKKPERRGSRQRYEQVTPTGGRSDGGEVTVLPTGPATLTHTSASASNSADPALVAGAEGDSDVVNPVALVADVDLDGVNVGDDVLASGTGKPLASKGDASPSCRAGSRRIHNASGAKAASRATPEVAALISAPASVVTSAPVSTGRLTIEEDRTRGSVSLSLYGRYLGAFGVPLLAITAATLLASTAGYVGTDWWLSYWSSAGFSASSSAGTTGTAGSTGSGGASGGDGASGGGGAAGGADARSIGYYIGVYAALTLATLALVLVEALRGLWVGCVPQDTCMQQPCGGCCAPRWHSSMPRRWDGECRRQSVSRTQGRWREIE
jgi:hypothetical protein